MIRDRYPEYDENRHYWGKGDLLELNTGYVLLCLESSGFKRSKWIVVKGFNKGNEVELNIQETPYLTKTEYSRDVMVSRCNQLKCSARKLKYAKGDIILREGNLFCITEVNCNLNYYAFVIDELNSTFYTHSSILLFNEYCDYMPSKGEES